jgi:hypothetical protein
VTKRITDRPHRRGGQPTKYRPQYCYELVDDAADGYSLTAFAGKIGVARDTLSQWGQVHPAFSVAIKRAQGCRTRWWEERARRIIDGGGSGGQVAMAIFALKNHAPDDFRDKIETVHSGTLTLAALVEQAHAQIADRGQTIEGETVKADTSSAKPSQEDRGK